MKGLKGLKEFIIVFLMLLFLLLFYEIFVTPWKNPLNEAVYNWMINVGWIK